MEVWGGENLELSLKAWSCPPTAKRRRRGAEWSRGRIEIAPCSRVGHVFRTWSPYHAQPTEINRNNKRVSEVWLDEYKYVYLDRLGRFESELAEKMREVGDVAERVELRRRLGCKPFRWFLDSVAVTLPKLDNLMGAGELGNPHTGLCVDQNDRADFLGRPAEVAPCHDEGGHQYWYLTADDYLMRDYTCLGLVSAYESRNEGAFADATEDEEREERRVTVVECGEAGQWRHVTTTLTMVYVATGECMTALPGEEKLNRATGVASLVRSPRPVVLPCDGRPEQVWIFPRFNPLGLRPADLAAPVVRQVATERHIEHIVVANQSAADVGF